MSFYKFFISFFFLNTAFATSSWAIESFPRGCEPRGFSYKDKRLLINEKGQQAFYLIQNNTSLNIQLKRIATEEAFMTPTLEASIDPKNWSAFSSDVQHLNFECIKKDNDGQRPVDCSKVLKICQYPRVKFALSNMGNYWVSVNKTQTQVINDAVSKGIHLRW